MNALKLHVPTTAIRIRRKPEPLTANFRWHFVRRGRASTTVCGILLKTGAHRWEGARLDKIDPRELCAICWPFGVEERQGRLFHA